MVRAPLHFHGRIPVPEVAPLTYRDGVTHLELVYELSQYLKNVLHPSLQSTVDQVVADAEQLLSDATAQYVDGVQEFQRIHDAFMSDVNASLIALNDGAVTDLVNDDTSKLGDALRDIFAKHADFQKFEEATTLRFDSFEETTQQRFDTFEEATDERLDTFESNTNESLTNLQQSVTQQFTDNRSQRHAEQRAERALSDQTDMVDILAGASSLGNLELRKSGSGKYPSFSVTQYYGGPNGFMLETSFLGGEIATNDDYQKMYETHGGYARRQSDGTYDYERTHLLTSTGSNREFALSIRPANRSTASAQWVPMHNGVPTAVRASDPLFMAPAGRIDMQDAYSGERFREIQGHLEVIQHVYGRHTATGSTNLIEIWTSHKFYPDGSVVVTGRWKALEDIYLDKGYVLMLPTNAALTQRVVTSRGRAYANTDAKYGDTETMENHDMAISYGVVLHRTVNFALAVSYDNAHETLRRDEPGKPDSGAAFIDHRNSSTMKIYNQLFEPNTLVKAGTSHRFRGRYVHAYAPHINNMIDLV